MLLLTEFTKMDSELVVVMDYIIWLGIGLDMICAVGNVEVDHVGGVGLVSPNHWESDGTESMIEPEVDHVCGWTG